MWTGVNIKLSALMLACASSLSCSTLQPCHAPISRPILTEGGAWFLDRNVIIDSKRVESPRRWDALRLLSSWQWDEPYWLHSIPGANEVYRLYYRPSLHNGSIVRVVRTGKNWTLSVRTQDSQALRHLQGCVLAKAQAMPMDCHLRRPIVDYDRALSSQEVRKLKRLLHSLSFWHLSENLHTKPSLDGIDWILEGFNEQHQNTYRVIRHDPDIKSTFYRFSEYLLEIAKVKQYALMPGATGSK